MHRRCVEDFRSYINKDIVVVILLFVVVLLLIQNVSRCIFDETGDIPTVGFYRSSI
jgi:hypothetical protein